ncbi:MAG TPA: hypothetical protein VN622_01845 [Clostridia bacterium]|nr:hypothetical protein [Clostridia bacterium]
MADTLYLSLWFPGFDAEDMLPRAAAVMRQFPYSATEPGVSYIAVQPIDWAQPTILERRMIPPATPEQVAEIVADFAQEDYALVFEAYWDLWTPSETGETWVEKPLKVRFIVHGVAFDEGVYEEHGHIEIDFGLDFPFLYEEMELTPENEEKVKANVAKLVDFSARVEKNCNITGRVLWNETEENLAQRLISRLQRVQ